MRLKRRGTNFAIVRDTAQHVQVASGRRAQALQHDLASPVVSIVASDRRPDHLSETRRSLETQLSAEGKVPTANDSIRCQLDASSAANSCPGQEAIIDQEHRDKAVKVAKESDFQEFNDLTGRGPRWQPDPERRTVSELIPLIAAALKFTFFTQLL